MEFSHHTLKEIMEGPDVLEETIKRRLFPQNGTVKLRGAEAVKERLLTAKRIHLIGCGTAYHAALFGEYLLSAFGGVPAVAETAAEFRYKNPALTEEDVVIAVSQSGETADTLKAVQESKEKGALAFGIINVQDSSIAKAAGAGIYTHAGTEKAILSTKAFVAQAVALAMLALFLGRHRHVSIGEGKKLVAELAKLPEKSRKILGNRNRIKKLAEKYARFSDFYLVGRKYNFPIALEGALKLKEGAYVHAEGLPGGELKHGPFALLDKSIATIAIAPNDSVREKMISTIQDIRSSGNTVLAIATEKDAKIAKLADDVISIPETIEPLSPILSVVPLQLFAYYSALERGVDVDKPRNLTKSVSTQ